MFETGLLRGKQVLITGGGTGLGLSMGKRFLELGASLAICGRREEVLKQASAELEQNAAGRVACTGATSATRRRSTRCSMRCGRTGRWTRWSTTRPAISSPRPRSCRRAPSTPCSASCCTARPT